MATRARHGLHLPASFPLGSQPALRWLLPHPSPVRSPLAIALADCGDPEPGGRTPPLFLQHGAAFGRGGFLQALAHPEGHGRCGQCALRCRIGCADSRGLACGGRVSAGWHAVPRWPENCSVVGWSPFCGRLRSSVLVLRYASVPGISLDRVPPSVSLPPGLQCV